MRLVGVPGGEQARHDWWSRLCADPKMCNSNAYFYVMEGAGSPEIDDDCRRDVEANGHCWCGKLQAAQIDGHDDVCESENVHGHETPCWCEERAQNDGNAGAQ